MIREIVPGSDQNGAILVPVTREDFSIRKRYGKGTRGDNVVQRGDFFIIDHGAEGGYDLEGVRDLWKFGNFFEMKNRIRLCAPWRRDWTASGNQKTLGRGDENPQGLSENIKVGRTAAETFEIIYGNLTKQELLWIVLKDLTKTSILKKTQVSIDLHGLGKGSYPPRIGSLGPDYQHEMTLQMYHHFAVEFFMYMPLPATEDKEDRLNLWFHDGAHATENGIAYLTPPPSEIHLIR